MDTLLPEFERMLKLLEKHDVSFMVIGGYAVIFHGYARTTTDMDIWLAPENANRDKLIPALREFGIDEESLQQLVRQNFEKALSFHFGQRPRRIDFLTKINTVSFPDAASKVNYFGIGGFKIPVINYHDLVLSKISIGRPQDKADIDMLQKINRYKEKK